MAEYLDINGAKTLLTGVKKYINNNAGGGLAFDLTQFKPAIVNFTNKKDETITVGDDVNLIYLETTTDATDATDNIKNLVIPKNKEILISIKFELIDNKYDFKINGKSLVGVTSTYQNSTPCLEQSLLTALYNGTNLIVNMLGQYKTVTTADSNSYYSYVPINMIHVL